MKTKIEKHMRELTPDESYECSGGRLWPFIDFIEALAHYQIGEDLFFYRSIPVKR